MTEIEALRIADDALNELDNSCESHVFQARQVIQTLITKFEIGCKMSTLWKKKSDEYHCPVCKYSTLVLFDYCPNCKIKMTGVK